MVPNEPEGIPSYLVCTARCRSPCRRYNAWVVLDAQVDVLLDAEAKVAGVGEVVLAQLVLTHLDSNR